MKLLKRIIINVYEDGRTTIEEEVFHFSAAREEEDKDNDTIRVICKITKSWQEYNLIIYSRSSELFEELTNKEDKRIKIKFNEKYFNGKIDDKYARIYSLKELMEYAKDNNMGFNEGDKVELVYIRSKDILCLNMIK